MLNILCTGHGTAAFGCGNQYKVFYITEPKAICPYCKTKTILTKKEYSSYIKEVVQNMIV